MQLIPESENIYQPARGMLLLAEPYIFDPNFNRTVILLTEHNDEGSVGFILNKKLELGLADIIDLDTQADIPVYYGGPVQNNTLHFIHRDPAYAEGGFRITDDIYWGGSFEHIQQSIERGNFDTDDFRFFLGYSGWSVGQLASELHDKNWIVAPATVETLFEKKPFELWRGTMRSLGGSFRIMANSPENPHMN